MVRMGVRAISMVDLHTSIHHLSALHCAALRFARAPSKPKTEEAFQILRFLLEWQMLKRADVPLQYLERRASDGLSALDRVLQRPDVLNGVIAFGESYLRCVGDGMGTINNPNEQLIHVSANGELRIVSGPYLNHQPTILKSAVLSKDPFEAEFRKIQLLREYLLIHQNFEDNKSFRKYIACLRGIVKVSDPHEMDCDIWLVFNGQYNVLSEYLAKEKLNLRERWRICRALFKVVNYMQKSEFARFEELLGSSHSLSLEHFLITVDITLGGKKEFIIRWNYHIGKEQKSIFIPPYAAANFSASEIGDYFGMAIAFHLILAQKNLTEFTAWYRSIVQKYLKNYSEEVGNNSLSAFEMDLENEFKKSLLPPLIRQIVVKLTRFGYQDLSQVRLELRQMRVTKRRNALTGSFEESFVPFDTGELDDADDVEGGSSVMSPVVDTPVGDSSEEEKENNMTGNKRKRDSSTATSPDEEEDQPPKKKSKTRKK